MIEVLIKLYKNSQWTHMLQFFTPNLSYKSINSNRVEYFWQEQETESKGKRLVGKITI